VTPEEKEHALELLRDVAHFPELHSHLDKALAGAAAMFLKELNVTEQTLRAITQVTNDVLRKDKRLTDEMLAAEVQRIRGDMAILNEFSDVDGWFVGGRVWLSEERDPVDGPAFISPTDDFGRVRWPAPEMWEEVITRFATLPHYDEQETP